MRIFWLTKLSDKDQYRRTQVEMSKALQEKGHIVTLIFARNFSEKKEMQKNIMYIPTINCSILSGFIFGIIIFFYLPLLIKKKKADIVIVSGDTIWNPFLLSFKFHRIPIILDIRSLATNRDTSLITDISLYFSKYFFDGYTTISCELKEILKKKYRFQNKKIGIWSSGVTKDLWNTYQHQHNIDNKIKSDKLILMNHGTYAPNRGIENLIRSIAELDYLIKKNIKLILVGIPRETKKELLALCEELKLTENVDVIPPVANEKIPEYILSSDIGIIPLPVNNLWWRVSVPLKTLEYLAMCTPIIATNIPFHKRLFEKGNCGVLIENNEPITMANAIMFLYKNKEKLREMGRKGREIVEKYYTWEKSANDLELFMNTVI